MADTKKMTTREFYTAVVNGNVSEEVTAKANELIAKLDETNNKRKNAPKKPSKASVENAPIAAAIGDFLAGLEDGKTALAKDIAVAVGQTVQKTSAVLRAMVEDGSAVKFVPENRNKSIEYSAPVADETAE